MERQSGRVSVSNPEHERDDILLEIRSRLETLSNDMETVKTDVKTVKTDLVTVRTDLETVKTDLVVVNKDLTRIDERLNGIDKRLDDQRGIMMLALGSLFGGFVTIIGGTIALLAKVFKIP